MEKFDIMQAMKRRHSVRRYRDLPIEPDAAELLQNEIKKVSSESGLNIKLFLNEPTAFSGKLAHYGSFENCKNYISIAGTRGRDEDVGYFGEKIVLFAQQLDINSCWVALTYSKSRVKAEPAKGEKLYIVISVGYGVNRGLPHKNKQMEALCSCEGEMPEWFLRGMDAVMLSPTAMNQQKFHFTCNANKVKAKHLLGPYAKIDLGIAKYHFELGAGKENFEWEA